MAVQTSAGSTIAMGSAPATYDAAGYGAVSYTTIGEVTDIGEFGAAYNLVTHNPVGNRQTKKFKGSYNNGSIQLQMAFDKADAGQDALASARDSDASKAFKVTLQDGTILYFAGKVMSFIIQVGSVDQILSATATIELDQNVIEV
jgi:hypothetical protein